jgi:hypothetical protein
MEQGETKTKDFIFKNVGNEDLKIRETSCGCVIGKTDISNRVVPPKGTGKIELTFNSKNKTGTISETIQINTNDPENGKVELNIKANVKPSAIPPIRICFFYSKD